MQANSHVVLDRHHYTSDNVRKHLPYNETATTSRMASDRCNRTVLNIADSIQLDVTAGVPDYCVLSGYRPVIIIAHRQSR